MMRAVRLLVIFSLIKIVVGYLGQRSSERTTILRSNRGADLCNPNIPFEGIKNVRDLSTAIINSPLGIKPTEGQILRTGCPSRATENDLARLKELGGLALVDLRSPKEWSRDEELEVGEVYEGYTNYRYSRLHRDWVKLDGTNPRFSIFSGSGLEDKSEKPQKKRFFASLTNERRIARGVFKRFGKRMKVKVLVLGLLSIISRRANKAFRSTFFERLNGGGLSLLYEIILDSAGPEIAAVMKVLSNANNLPSLVYCTAGKDRTGLVSMLVLSVLGASDTEILTDYHHSDSAYADIGSEEAMVMALEQTEVKAEVFLRAPPQTMKDTLQYIRQKYGGVNKYLDRHSFNDVYRNKLRNALIVF